MLEVTFYRDSRDRLSSIFACGHAEFADYGDDIVCAAVSAVLQAARLGLERHARLDLRASQAPGTFRIHIPPEARSNDGVVAIVATAQLAVDRIAAQFPDHVRVAYGGETETERT